MTTWLGSGAADFAASAAGAGAAGAGQPARRAAGAAGSADFAAGGAAGASCAALMAGLKASIAATTQAKAVHGTLNRSRARCHASAAYFACCHQARSSWLPGSHLKRERHLIGVSGGLLLCCSKRVSGGTLVKVSRFYSRTCDLSRVLPRGNNPLAIAPLFGTPNPNSITSKQPRTRFARPGETS